jgi:replicative DNA helicase
MIAKQRNGPLGEVDLVFMRESATFGNPDPEFQ